MLISTAKVADTEPWSILEPDIGQAPDVLALRIKKQMNLFRAKGQVLIPMRRNSSGNAEWIVEHVYVRGLNGDLDHIAHTRGIAFKRPEIAPTDWIVRLLKAEQQEVPKAIVNGQFVRVLTGPCARMCGHVVSHLGGRVIVSIKLPTKTVRVHTDSRNLQVVECPQDQQYFWYAADFA